MAGDWIPLRLDLAEDPAVIAVASITGLDEFGVIGRLHRLWSWANSQSRDGYAPGVTEKWIDRLVSVTGFAAALVKVDWLTVDESGIAIPNFEVWNSQSAKRRLLAAKRMQKKRGAECDAPSVTKAQPEERREEYKNPPNPPDGGNEVFAALAEITGTDSKTNKRALDKAAAKILEASPPYTAADVRAFGARYWELCPYARDKIPKPGAGEVARKIGLLRSSPRKPRPAYVPAPGRPADAMSRQEIQAAYAANGIDLTAVSRKP